MTTPLLSICIATYNRAEYIGETLESIIPQLDNDVELLVVDGASTDNTEDVMQRYVEVDPRIRYIRLPAKGGVDQDYDKTIELAHGEYCWLFTDDDLMKAGAIEQVLLEIAKGYSLIIINAEVWNHNFSTLISTYHLSDRAHNVYDPHEFDDFFQHCVSYLSFIGAIVIKKDIWENRDKASYFGTEFVHIGVIFQKLLPTPIRLITKPYIKIRYGNAQWTSRKFAIWMVKWPQLLWSFNLISLAAKQRIVAREPWRKLRSLFIYRSLAAFDIAVLKKLISQYAVSYLWLIIAACISLFPVKLAGIITLKYHLISGKTKDLMYYDLLETLKK